MQADDFTKLVLEGDALARGRAHGEARRDLIKEHYARWFDAIERDLGVHPKRYIRVFLEETNFFPAIKRWTPDLLDEVRGIADGADEPFETVFARQLSDEEPWFRRDWKFAHPSHGGCTSLASWRDENVTYVAQNMDVPHWCDGLQMLLHIKDSASDIEVFEFTLAGKISLAGMNNAGLGMCCNTLSQLDSSKNGLPEDFVVRGFLEHARLSDGVEFLEKIVHASGQNYTIGEPGAPALNLECSSRSVKAFVSAEPPQCVYHSNHPLTNKDQSMFLQRTEGLSEAEQVRLYHGTSYARLASLEEQLSPLSEGVQLADIIRILSSHDAPICRHGDTATGNDNFTLGCLVMELGPEPVFHIAPGPPCETDFLSFRFY